MRIQVWAQSYRSDPGGIQTFTRFLVRALGDLYPDAEIVVFAKNDREETNKEIDGEVAINGTRVARGPRKVIGFGRWPGPVRAIAFALGVARHAIVDRPDMIISTHVNFAPVARVIKKLGGHARFCAIGHGIEVWTIPKTSLRRSLRSADQLVAVSDFTRVRMAKALDLDPAKIALLPNTFDAERFQPAQKPKELLERYGLSADQPVILTVARLAETEQYKGYDNVILALPAVLNRFPDARYIIVGDGPDRPRVEALSRRLHVQDKVMLAGYVPNEELADHYNLCDVFAMPSKGEGFGIVFLEALGCGKPVIAGNKDGSVEAILNGKLGLLVDPDDEREIGEAICRVLARRDEEVERRKEKVEIEAGAKEETGGGDRQSENSGQSSNKPELRTDNLELQLDSAVLRNEVINAYGYERFRSRLGEIVEKLKSGQRKG